MKRTELNKIRKSLSADNLGQIVFSNFLNNYDRQIVINKMMNEAVGDTELRHALENTFEFNTADYSNGIGGCPEYDNLEYDDIAEGYNTTLVIDLVNFTARSLHSKNDIDKLKELAILKKKFINSCAVAVGMFNGHIHDITGDGIMAFFNVGERHEQINEAMLAAIFMIYAVKEILNPSLKDENPSHRDIQVRVGVDTGSVIWTKMGSIKHLNSCEVKAVGFSVDSAAKLSSGNSWELKIGEDLYNQGKEKFKELTSKYDDYKRTIDGLEIIYKRYYFDWEKYVRSHDNNIGEVIKSRLPLLGYGETVFSQAAMTLKSIDKLSKPNNHEKIFG
ncbi:hypothetical protein HZF24_01535 [Sedimentibacter hydroxybenzoicus DSM 7310]|uniref:Guanylate cyclase domain-containing protein n=1 Tax=Sedimentibacter hydroxybenzoicus DSM 7310 TaxID=1123245 RepID=A0A974GUZ2_SEDHY|nr:adenylate/guanylate cyclase domain-containing protein [Sedimentibacter hydroxybenzoicus]NYB72817.1 hypothetical protein [Sedimentibacter hydroxybenzoicus DSM 7310]